MSLWFEFIFLCERYHYFYLSDIFLYRLYKNFRDASVCSLSCSNGISEGGKTFVRTCLNGEWVGDIDDMECDGKICHIFVTILSQ